ncbi:MAG TPA: type II secretion system protein [Candidatus Baltobacteraceae bacterium]|jgi:type II secretory pathway pseudopilin PulG|nr:type II secretion system protein [Candidatus Baltobacteraceae bacterium]
MKVTLPTPEMVSRRSGFTLIETTMVMGILVILVGSIVMCNLFGLSMSDRQQIWLSASDDAAQALGTLMSDIRSGASNYVGNGDLNGFTNIAENTPEVGNALKIWVGTTNTGTNIPWILYYYNTTSNTLVRTNYTGSNYGDFKLVSANPITNDNYIFTESDYLGNVLTNAVATPIIQVYLSFTKLQNPQIEIAPGSPVDFYQIITTIASRNRP